MNKNSIVTISAFEAELNVLLEEINFDLWIEELEAAAAYRSLVSEQGSRRK